MSGNFKVAVLVGSLRKDSVNRKLALAMTEMAPPGLRFQLVDIGQLPFYNEDNDDPALSEWQDFRDTMKKVDAVLFVTPEYNRSVPAVLKNALDVGSRPMGESVWDGKPGAVVTASPGGIGGFGANHHLRQSLVFLNVPTLQQPEMYIGNAYSLFDEQGKLNNDGTRQYLKGFLAKFTDWIEANSQAA